MNLPDRLEKVAVIGIGDDGIGSLSAAARSVVEQAEILFGGERHLDFFPGLAAERVVVKSNLKEVAEIISRNLGKRRMVVLASGDPLFYGIGKYLLSRLGKERISVLPNLSSMQLAFARIKESWEDAVLVSVHAKPVEEIVDRIRDAKQVGLFTDDQNTPGRIAQVLMAHGINGFQAFVCENLGGEDERIVEAELRDLPGRTFAPLNVLLLIQPEYRPETAAGPRSWSLGVPDVDFHQRMPQKGLITKMEVRVVSLARMRLRKDSSVWDIGAGCGSVSIEAAFLAPDGHVAAIEKNAEDCEIIRRNLASFSVRNVTVVHGMAPECLGDATDDPDAVFVGGSGGSMKPIIRESLRRLRPGGALVANVATLENLHETIRECRESGRVPDITSVQIARSRPLLDLTRLEALNPVFVVSIVK